MVSRRVRRRDSRRCGLEALVLPTRGRRPCETGGRPCTKRLLFSSNKVWFCIERRRFWTEARRSCFARRRPADRKCDLASRDDVNGRRNDDFGWQHRFPEGRDVVPVSKADEFVLREAVFVSTNCIPRRGAVVPAHRLTGDRVRDAGEGWTSSRRRREGSGRQAQECCRLHRAARRT